jgi:hypothetical protein
MFTDTIGDDVTQCHLRVDDDVTNTIGRLTLLPSF